MGYRYDEDTGSFVGTGDEEGQVFARREEEGGGFVNLAGEEYARQQYQAPSYTNYDLALSNYSSRKVPWLYTSVSGDSGYGSTESQGGLSDRQAFNLNALWGGTQYAAGRVSDFTHIDPTQLQANQIAGNVRDELWNEYDRLKAQGNTPAKNPDEVALDFYVQTVGPQGSQYGYGPGANTILLTEAIKNKFLNQPEVISSTGSRYQTPASQLDAAKAFDESHKVGATVWKIFEDQGVSSGGFGRFIPLIIGAIAFPGMGAALTQAMGGTIAANIAAASIIGGLNAEIQGGDFIDGAIKSALTAGTGAALANVGVAAEVSSALESVGIDANLANKVADTAERAITSAIVAEATGGDAGDAILNTLVAAGVSAVRNEVTDIVNNITAGTAPSDIEDAEIGAAMTEAVTQPQETPIVAPQQPEVVASPAPEPEVVALQPIPAGSVTPEEIISAIQPEPVVSEPIVTEEAVVPRETTEVPPEVVAEAQPEPVTPAPEAVVEPTPAEIAPITPEEILQEIAPEQPVIQEPIPETVSAEEPALIEPAAPTEPVVEPVVEPAPEQTVEQAPVAVEPEVVPEVVPEPAPEAIPEEPVISDQDLLQALVDEGLLPRTEVTPEEAAPVEPAPEELALTEPTTPAETPAEPSVVPEEPAAVEPVTPSEPAAELPLEAVPVEEAPVSDQDLLQALVDEGLLPAEAVTPEPDAPEVALEDPVEEQPVEEMPVEEVVVEPVVEEAPVFEEPLPEEQPIPEAMPEVEPEPVLPEEGAIEEEAAPEEEPAPEESMPEESAIGDQEVLDALAEEDTGEGAAPEEGSGEEVAPEGEEVLPAEELTEETPEEEPGTERQPTEAPSSLDKLIASLLLSEQGGGSGSQRRSVTQESISPREISGSVTGIIGKKQPMFSGDEDEQSAEWNRRSLRLRKVLGL